MGESEVNANCYRRPCLKIFVTERWRETGSALVFEDFITFRRCRRSGTLGRRRGAWRRETPSTLTIERARGGRDAEKHARRSSLSVTGDRVCLALIAFHRSGARGGAEARCRETPSPIVFDDFIALAFQRGIGATRPAKEVCRSVGRTCDGYARSSRVRRDGRGGARASSPPSLSFRARDRGR